MSAGLLLPRLRDAHRACPAVGVVLGSFDPLHRGHQWMVRQLARRGCELVLLLIPARHPFKRWRSPRNATHGQRLRLIERAPPGDVEVLAGISDEVLFHRLQLRVARVFPAASLLFGIGSDTFDKVLATPARSPRWGARDDQLLRALLTRTVVFARSVGDARPGAVVTPAELHGVCSTSVRQVARRLHRQRANAGRWRAALGGAACWPVIDGVRRWGIYREGPPIGRHARQRSATRGSAAQV